MHLEMELCRYKTVLVSVSVQENGMQNEVNNL